MTPVDPPPVPPAHPADGGADVCTTTTVVHAQVWARTVLRTPWLHPGHDVGALLRDRVVPLAVPGDVIIISEKALAIALGRVMPLAEVVVTPFAARLARMVRPRGDSKGLSVPQKMQHVVDAVGRPRVLAAITAAGLTRPFGINGAFYVVAGWRARAVDGGRPPFESLLLPPLDPAFALLTARSLEAATGFNVAVVDINDRGGSVRAVSGGPMTSRRLRRILHDNPMGQRDARTPIGLVHRVIDGPAPGV